MIADIEKAIQAQLESYRLLQNKTLKAGGVATGLAIKIGAYGGQIDDHKLAEIAQTGPSCWVVFTGSKRIRKLTYSTIHEVNFSVLVSAKSLDDAQSRHGGHGGKIMGAYGMIDFAHDALEGFKGDDGLIILPLEHLQTTNLFNAKYHNEFLAIYGLAFKTQIEYRGKSSVDLDDFSKINLETTPAIGNGDATKTDITQKRNNQ